MSAIEDAKTVIDFLGEKNADKIRDALTDAIIENLEESVQERWIVLPTTFNEMYEDICEEVMRKYRKKLKDTMCEEVENFIKERFKKEK